MSNSTYQENMSTANTFHFEINNLTLKRGGIIFLALISRLLTTATSALRSMKRLLTFDRPLMRSVGRWAAMGLLLALAVTLGSREVASAATLRTINLNTGYDQSSNLLIPVGQRDNEWRVTSPPLNGGAAFVVNDSIWVGLNPSLPANFPMSRWISTNTSPASPNPAPSSYKYEFYFTLPPGFSSPQITMKLSSDDRIASVTLNGNSCSLFTGPGGNFNLNPPLMFSSFAPGCFQSGPNVNVITVTVEDTGGVVTGLIVEGTMTYEDCDRMPVRKLSGLQFITFYESTFGPAMPIQIPISDMRLAMQIPIGSLGSGFGQSKDFEGVPNAEFYDVFFSDWDGTFNLNGEFITIEAVWDIGAPSGGGLNIAAVQLSFASGSTMLADFVSTFAALGNNAIPLDVGKAVDATVLTDTTMGNTIGPQKQRLRVTVGFPCPCAPPPSGMVAWWPLNEQSGQIVNDIVGGHHGTTINFPNPAPIGGGGPTSIGGSFVGNSLQFGFNIWAEVSPTPALNFGTGPFTIDAWIKSTQPLVSEGIVEKRDLTQNGYTLRIATPFNTGMPELQLIIGNTAYHGPVITAPVGTWIFVAATRTGNTVKLYVNNTSLTATSPATPSASSTDALRIGFSSPTASNLAIDEVEIFNRDLSQTEIQSIFSAQSVGKCRRRRTVR